ncbi:hypothetical protein AB5I41_24090 [Sphingomonas sp. MMS24-JH45]
MGQGLDFPTGRLAVDPPAAIREAMTPGAAASACARAGRSSARRAAGGRSSSAKSPTAPPRVIQQIAGLVNDRSLPILADVRDESDAEVRLVLEPRSRTVDPQVLMDGLFRLSDLEVRVPLNLNVLDKDRTPRVMSLSCRPGSSTSSSCCGGGPSIASPRCDVELVVRRTSVAFLNLDRVIEIIRTEDEPKAVMMAEFGADRPARGDPQHAAALPAPAGRDGADPRAGRAGEGTGRSDAIARQRAAAEDADEEGSGEDPRPLRRGDGAGKRRTTIEEAAPTRDIPLEAMIEREPITVILSQRGWIRDEGACRPPAPETLKFKEGDGPAFACAQTTDKLLLAAERPLLHAGGRQTAGRTRVRGAVRAITRRQRADHRLAGAMTSLGGRPE